jgi:hypothetical protein
MSSEPVPITYYKRTGRILPGSQSLIAEWLAANNADTEAEDD